MSHLAAILPSQGARLEVSSRPTPTPGPDELLISVSSIAINLVDCYQRNVGLFLKDYPAVLGSDVAGVIVSRGSSVTAEDLTPGTRVAAFATAFFNQGAPDYGAFQKMVVVDAANAVPLPEEMSFNEAAMLPMAVSTAWTGPLVMGIPTHTKLTAADKKSVLVWGGASSVGSVAVQVFKILGFTVYVTASEKHHSYMKELGASRVFDYQTDNVVSQIVQAAKEDGVTMNYCYDAVPDTLEQCIAVLKELGAGQKTYLACAPQVPQEYTKVEAMQVTFCQPPADKTDRAAWFHDIFNVWLKEKLASGELVPAPKLQVIDGGLESINSALDQLMKGVSGVKLVVEI